MDTKKPSESRQIKQVPLKMTVSKEFTGRFHTGNSENKLVKAPIEDEFKHKKTNSEEKNPTPNKCTFAILGVIITGIVAYCSTRGRNKAALKNPEKALIQNINPISISKQKLFGLLENLTTQIKNVDINDIFLGGNGLKLRSDKVILNKPELKPLEDTINKTLDVFPEFKTIIGVKQHDTHRFSLDGHILVTLQNCANDAEFLELSNESKRVLTLSTLLHDISKKEGVIDKFHPINSAEKSKIIVERLDISDSDKDRLYKLIKNHHWVEELSNGKMTSDGTIIVINPEDIIKDFVHPEDFKMMKIMARADLKAVGNEELYERCKNSWIEQASRIQKVLDKIL